MLMDIAEAAANSSVRLHISIFATCDCKAVTMPPIPNSEITNTGTRPDVYQLLAHMVSPTMVEDDADYESKASAERVISQGGVGVCASGPESLTREAANAVARLAPAHGARVGGITLHTEVFSL
jgi:ferric-chelate reductase